MAKLISLQNSYFALHEGTARNRSVVEGVVFGAAIARHRLAGCIPLRADECPTTTPAHFETGIGGDATGGRGLLAVPFGAGLLAGGSSALLLDALLSEELDAGQLIAIFGGMAIGGLTFGISVAVGH
ncbi:MAG: hypothetical protein IT384_18400 [Deltaproteobacteria bacterium]|nr:hypothetical protein [Deltaproteobacteria bacterium]